MNIEEIRSLIGNGDETLINNYLAYVYELETKKKKGVVANPWMKHKTPAYLARIYNAVAADNIIFDGIDVTLQNTGISYSYQAYKNRMIAVYPESIIDVGLVYNGDTFNFKKESGTVKYNHTLLNPFSQTDDNIIGGYCVIKNKRGEFLTTLTRPDIDKHRRVAKTDYIWKAWFVEMAMKTLIKKACKTHFKDSFTTIETLDNENYDLDKLEQHISREQVAELNSMITKKNIKVDKLCKHFEVESIESIKPEDFEMIKSAVEAKK